MKFAEGEERRQAPSAGHDRRAFLKSLGATMAIGVGLTRFGQVAHAATSPTVQPDTGCVITCQPRCGDGYCPAHGQGGNHFYCSGCNQNFDACYNLVCSAFCLSHAC